MCITNLKQDKLFAILILLIQYNLSAQDWTPVASMGTGNERYNSVSFSIGGKGYITTGENSTDVLRSTWEYNPDTDTWAQKADFTGSWNPRTNASGFVIGDKGYVIGGRDDVNSLHSDFWEYNPSSNIWTQKSNYPGGKREYLVAFGIGNMGYVGLGFNVSRKFDFYKYNPADDSWTQLPNIEPTAHMMYTNVFVLNGKAYYATGLGYDGGYSSRMYMFDPNSVTWTQKNNFPNEPRVFGVSFTLENKAYLGLGFVVLNTGTDFRNDMWQYKETNDTWIQCNNFNPGSRLFASAFTIGNRAYIGSGTSPGGIPFASFYSGQPTLSTKEFLVDSFKITSTNNKIIISSDLIKEYNIDLFDMNGKKVLSQEFQNANSENEIIHQLPAGVYVINFTIDEKSFSKKIIVP